MEEQLTVLNKQIGLKTDGPLAHSLCDQDNVSHNYINVS